MKEHKLGLFVGVLAVIAAATILFLLSCGEDCPTCPTQPKPYKGWLYALNYWNGWIYQIDLETDSVVDSLHHETERYSTGAFDVSKDGKYLAVNYTHTNTNPYTYQVRIFDAQTLHLITEISGGGYPVFTEDVSKLIVCGESLRMYSIPDFSLLFEDEIGRTAQPVLRDNYLYLLAARNWASGDSEYVEKYDYIAQELVDTFIIADDQGNWFRYNQFDVSKDGRYLYFGGYAGTVASSLNCYDLETRQFIFRHYVFSVNGDIRLNPEGTEVYFTDPGYSTTYESPGTVFIYDAQTGTYLGGISLFGYTSGEDAFYPLYASYVTFTPDGNWAYVGTGNVFTVSGGIVVIDANKRQVQKIIWPELGQYIHVMKICPKT